MGSSRAVPSVAGAGGRRGRVRRAVAAVLLALAVCAGTVGGVAVVFRDTVVDGQEFADRVVAALSTPQAREVIGERVADEIVAQAPQTLAVRPLIETVVEGALSTQTFQDILAAAVADLHATVLARQPDTVTLRLVDLVLVAKAQLAAISPNLAALIPDDLTDALVRVSAGAWDVDAVGLFDRVRVAAFLGPLLALVLLAAYVALAVDRRRGLLVAGAMLAVVGAALVTADRVARTAVLGRISDADARTVAAAVWDRLTGDVGTLALGLAGLGAGLATLTALVGHGLRPADLLARAAELARVPTRPGARAVWCAATVVAGLLLVLDGPQVARFALVATGAALLLTGMSEAIRLITPTRRRMHATTAGPVPAAARPGRRRLRWAAAAVVAITGLATGGAAIDRSGGIAPVAGSDDPRCNGSVLLCDRPFDQVVIPATHNAMAAADEGFLAGNQPHGIIAQLDAGYRGLLVDVHYGLRTPNSSLVVTDRAPATAAQRKAQVAEVGEAAVRAAEALRRRTQTTGGTRGTYLCHEVCEVGATPFQPQLVAIRDWLQAHPKEVIVIVVEDYVTPQDAATAFRSAGLDRYAYTHPAGTAWPTLGQMIAGGHRLLVLAEKAKDPASAAPWYQPAFTLTQDTPYSFGSVSEFSCRRNRGRADSPLFQVNHFITPASVTAAEQANSAAVLRTRLQRCQRERHHIPNIVAVDFYDRGDVLRVVDQLNGIRSL